MSMVEQIKKKYTDSGFLLKEDFDKKFISAYGDGVEWKPNTTEILFSMMTVLPYFTLRGSKLEKLLSLPNFNRFIFYSDADNSFNVFLSFTYKHIADFKILKKKLHNFLWEELSIPVKEDVVTIDSEFEADLLVPRNTKIESFIDLNIELSALSLSNAIAFSTDDLSLTHKLNSLVDVRAKTNYKIINIRSEE